MKAMTINPSPYMADELALSVLQELGAVIRERSDLLDVMLESRGVDPETALEALATACKALFLRAIFPPRTHHIGPSSDTPENTPQGQL